MAAPVFSYAQAAKGQAAAQSISQLTSPAPASTSSQSKDDVLTASTSVTAPSVTSNDTDHRDSVKNSQSEVESGSRQDSEATSAPLLPVSEQSMGVGFDNHASSDTQPEVGDKSPRSASQASRSQEGAEPKKSRKGRKGKNTDRDGEQDQVATEEIAKETPKLVLSEAPVPSVNIWAQRIEAQAAKAKSSPVPASISAPSTTAPGSSNNVVKARDSVGEIDSNGGMQNGMSSEKAHRKLPDSQRVSDQVSRKSAQRGSRAGEKDDKLSASLPPVADASSWPDPKSAAATEEGKRKIQDKQERIEREVTDDSGASKRPKDKWVTMPYVPSVTFQTQLPQRGSKPRGGARGGREAGGIRGAQSTANPGANPAPSAATDKNSATSSSTKPMEPRSRENSTAARAMSATQGGLKHSPPDSSSGLEQRKSSASTGSLKSKDSAGETSSAANGKTDGVRNGRYEVSSINNEAANSSRSGLAEQSNDPKASGQPKDGNNQSANSLSYSSRERSDGRSDRGRGGYRRGGQHIQPGGFPSNGQYPPHATFPARANGPLSPTSFSGSSQSYSPAVVRGGRGGGRTNSGPNRGTSNGTGFSAKMSHNPPPHLDYNTTATQPYIYPLPYATDYHLINGAQTQLEYYFSVSNLCRDMFLRKRMDSQGFVLLNTISHFPRMISLASESQGLHGSVADMVRIACSLSEVVECVVGHDNVERLRTRENWRQWVLEMDQREEEARNDGPTGWYARPTHSHLTMYPPAALPPAFPSASPPLAPGFLPEDHMFHEGYVNGGHFEADVTNAEINGQNFAGESQLSAAVPEFSPSPALPPLTLESMTNFADHDLETLNVLTTMPNGHVGMAEHGLLNGSSSAAEVSASMAEGASFQGCSVNNELYSPTTATDMSSHQKGEPYLPFRLKALERRKNIPPGESPIEMSLLYHFWLDFLSENFNAGMYDDFRSLAIDDASQQVPNHCGLKLLLALYTRLLHGEGRKPWGSARGTPEIFSLHYQEALALDHPNGVNGTVRI